MTLVSALVALAACTSTTNSSPDALATTTDPIKAPRLVVVISIDQFRADYLTRFADNYLPAMQGATIGGFNFLTGTGANYIDCHYQHAQTSTGPGHATIMTGSVPALNGVVDNGWFDRQSKKDVYCVDDPGVKVPLIRPVVGSIVRPGGKPVAAKPRTSPSISLKADAVGTETVETSGSL